MGMGGRVWEWVKLFGDSTARQIPKFQPGGFRSSAASLMAAGRGRDRIQGAVDSGGGCEGAGARENAPAAATAALVHHCEPPCFMRPIGKGVETQRPPIGPRATAVFLDLFQENNLPFCIFFNDRSATWIRILIALNFRCLVFTMDENKKQCSWVAISSHLLNQTR